MKRIIALLMAVMMMATLFVGCGSEETTDTASKDSASASELAQIKENGKLVIGYTVYAPMNYTDDKGEFVGFDTEYAKLVCEELGVKAEFVEINWETKEVDLNSGKIDCIWNGFTITDEREEQLDFTTPYLRNKQVVVIRKADASKYKDAKSLASAALTAEKGSAGETAIKDSEELKGAAYVESDLQTSALMAVKAMTADACVVDYTVATSMAGQGDYSDLMMIEDLALIDEQYGIGFRTGSDITAKVNEITKKFVSDGTFGALAQKYELESSLIK